MTTVQILLITLIAYWKMTDTVTLQLFAFNTIICGWLVGLVMGDPATGLTIGATLQLMSMGVVALEVHQCLIILLQQLSLLLLHVLLDVEWKLV